MSLLSRPQVMDSWQTSSTSNGEVSNIADKPAVKLRGKSPTSHVVSM